MKKALGTAAPVILAPVLFAAVVIITALAVQGVSTSALWHFIFSRWWMGLPLVLTVVVSITRWNERHDQELLEQGFKRTEPWDY